MSDRSDDGSQPRGKLRRPAKPRRASGAEGGARSPGRPKPRGGPSFETSPARKPGGASVASGAWQKRPADRNNSEARIAKVMARAGLCSRRDAEAWIAAGRVSVNGARLSGPAFNVSPQDAVLVDGRPLASRERTRLFLFHKPRGLVSTARDPEGRPTIFSRLPEDLPRLVTIGRLDINTEGLLLLTNDGGLARLLELPTTAWLRRYRVRANGATDQAALDRLRDGVTIEGMIYAGIEATLDRVKGANVWLTMGLREGKNREVKRVLEHLGLLVNRLIRVSFGPFQLGELAEGAVEEVRTRVIEEQLGPELTKRAGLDFDGTAAPIVTRELRDRRGAEPGGGPRPYHTAPHKAPPGFRNSEKEPARSRGNRAHRGPGNAAPEPQPRRFKPKPGPRKHISVLRAEERAEQAAARKRIERAQTADRKGRTVAVERVVRANPASAEQVGPFRSARAPDDGPERRMRGRAAGGGRAFLANTGEAVHARSPESSHKRSQTQRGRNGGKSSGRPFSPRDKR